MRHPRLSFGYVFTNLLFDHLNLASTNILLSTLWRLKLGLRLVYYRTDRAPCGKVAHLYWLLKLRLGFLILECLYYLFGNAWVSKFSVRCKLSQCYIIVVATEHILSRLSVQWNITLFEVVVLDISPLFIYVFLIKVILIRRDEGCLEFLFV